MHEPARDDGIFNDNSIGAVGFEGGKMREEPAGARGAGQSNQTLLQNLPQRPLERREDCVNQICS
jgi:hypothetical protein